MKSIISFHSINGKCMNEMMKHAIDINYYDKMKKIVNHMNYAFKRYDWWWLLLLLVTGTWDKHILYIRIFNNLIKHWINIWIYNHKLFIFIIDFCIQCSNMKIKNSVFHFQCHSDHNVRWALGIRWNKM